MRHVVRPLGANKYFSQQEQYRKKELVVVTNSDHPMYEFYESTSRGKQLALLHMEHMIEQVAIFLETRTDKPQSYWRDQIERMFSIFKMELTPVLELSTSSFLILPIKV